MRFDLSRRTRSVLGVVGWLAAAAAATTVGVLVVGAIGTGIVGSTSDPQSSREVDRALASATPAPRPSASPTPPASGSTPGPTHRSPSGDTRVLGSSGGTVLARCTDGRATLVSWSPRQGYEADDVRRGPDREASIKFESDDRKVRVRVSCAGGVPRADVESEADD